MTRQSPFLKPLAQQVPPAGLQRSQARPDTPPASPQQVHRTKRIPAAPRWRSHPRATRTNSAAAAKMRARGAHRNWPHGSAHLLMSRWKMRWGCSSSGPSAGCGPSATVKPARSRRSAATAQTCDVRYPLDVSRPPPDSQASTLARGRRRRYKSKDQEGSSGIVPSTHAQGMRNMRITSPTAVTASTPDAQRPANHSQRCTPAGRFNGSPLQGRSCREIPNRNTPCKPGSWAPKSPRRPEGTSARNRAPLPPRS